MPRTEAESNAINRMLKAWGMPSLEHPEVLAHFGSMVKDHNHFRDILKACKPGKERNEAYDAMSPHLRFKAKPLDEYISAAKEYAEAAQLPTIEADGTLKPFRIPEIEIPEFELWVVCSKCEREGFFYGERKADAIFELRKAGWSWEELGFKAICANCLGEDE